MWGCWCLCPQPHSLLLHRAACSASTTCFPSWNLLGSGPTWIPTRQHWSAWAGTRPASKPSGGNVVLLSSPGTARGAESLGVGGCCSAPRLRGPHGGLTGATVPVLPPVSPSMDWASWQIQEDVIPQHPLWGWAVGDGAGGDSAPQQPWGLQGRELPATVPIAALPGCSHALAPRLGA